MQYANVTVMDLQLLREEKSEREGRREIFLEQVTFTYRKNFVTFIRCLFS